MNLVGRALRYHRVWSGRARPTSVNRMRNVLRACPSVADHVHVRLCVRENMQTQRRDIATYKYAYVHNDTWVRAKYEMIATGAFINSIRLYNRSTGKRYVTLACRLAYVIQFSL